MIADYHVNVAFSKSVQPGVAHLELGMNKDLFNFMDNKLRLGFGVRVGVQDNQQVTFTTARKALKDSESNIDSLYYDQVQGFSFNFYANGEYYLKSWLSVGLNTDILGITTGFEKDATYSPGMASAQSGASRDIFATARPTAANAFSFGDQKGMLMSQLFVRFEPSKQISFKLGYSILMAEYSTVESYGGNTQYRFENHSGAFAFGISFNKFDNK